MNIDLSATAGVALSDWGVIQAEGPDAASFLHSQLTSDIEHLNDSTARLAGYCSAKGRLLASFVVWRPAPDRLLLACHASVLEPTLKRLSMFVLRAKCRLNDASDRVRMYGVIDAPVSSQVPWSRDGWWIHLPGPDPLALCVIDSDADTPMFGRKLTLAQWQACWLRAGVPVIERATIEQFVPQMVNLELVGGVDFRKGCYPGQEIVARSQYRGTLKRRMALFETDAPAQAGEEVFHDADQAQPAGMVVNAASINPGEAGHRLLAEVKLTALDQGALHLGRPDGPVLARRELPYAIDVDVTDDA